ncbi:MAG: polyphosphate kinase [Hymenobacteraceae bacterium]|nr:polyphosphate kinase [Hymenobacteraceae bacterium]
MSFPATPTTAPDHFKKAETKEKTLALYEELAELQNLLYADNSRSLLVVLQGMDASGKDGLIRKVIGAFNPQGVIVTSFKVPSDEERAHDFLWRLHQHTPARGMVAVWNRSHYEDVLVTRVEKIIDDAEAKRRFRHLNDFEQLLTDAGTMVLKFYLHVSPDEQAARLAERQTDPAKLWKHDVSDAQKAAQRPAYQAAYADIFAHCQEAAPWHIVPADQNWYKEYLVAQALRDALVGMKLKFPPPR